MIELRLINCSGTDPGAEQTYIYWDRVRSFMQFTGMSFATLARKSQTPESTLRKLLQGVTKDPRISTVQPVFKALELDANIALGLAPPRDYEAEITQENVPLTDALKQQLSEVRAERDSQLAELDRLRKLVLSKGETLSRLEGRAIDVDALTRQCADQQQRLECKAQKIQDQAEEIACLREKVESRERTVKNLESLTARQRKELLWMKIATAVLVSIIIAAAAYMAWEIINPDSGMIKWRGYFK